MIGSPPEMSPEKARGEAHGFPAEVWAVATIVFFMLNGVEPWIRSCDSKLQLLFQVNCTFWVVLFSGVLYEQSVNKTLFLSCLYYKYCMQPIKSHRFHSMVRIIVFG